MIALALKGLESVFGWLLEASWQASVLAALVLFVQWLLGSRLNPRWRYALWLLVLLRLVLPVLPESAFSLFQYAPKPSAALTAPVTEPLFLSAPDASPQVHVLPMEKSEPLSLYSLLALAWLAGALILLVLTWQVNRRFALQIRRSPEITDPELLEIFAKAQAGLGLYRSLRLIENGQVQSPAIMGLFQPTLLLPADVRAKFDPTELRLIFLHELAHLKRGDVIVQWLIAVLQIIHWFNPALWFAFRRMRADREPATDALVLSRTGEDEKERYGLMLIKLLEHFNQRHSLPTLVGILEDKDQFKRRFSLIARFTRGAYGWSLLGVFIIAILAAACLTKSKAIDSIASTSQVWPPADLNKSIGFTALGATGEINPPTDPAINATIDSLKLATLDIPTLPLHLYLDELAKVLKKQNPDREQVTFILTCPEEDQPHQISFHLQHPSTLREIMAQLNVQYPLRYQIRGPTDIIVWQISHFETDFKKQAAKTTVDLSFEHATLAEALKTVQTAAAAKGFVFDISNFADTRRFPADAPHDITLQQRQIPLDQALRYILITSQTRLSYEPDGPNKKYFITSALLDFPTEPMAKTTDQMPSLNAPATAETYFNQAVDKGAIKTTDASGLGEEPFTVRTFIFPDGFFETKSRDTVDIKRELISHGIEFSGDATVIYLPAQNKFVVRNTREQLDKIVTLIETANLPASTTLTAPPVMNISIRDAPQTIADANNHPTDVLAQELTKTDEDINPSPPPANAAGTTTAKNTQIEIEFKLAEITEDAYQAHKTAIDSAMDKGGFALIDLLNNVKGVSLLAAPRVTTQPGLKANIDIVREFPYPVSFDNAYYVSGSNGGPNVSVPPTPREFVAKNIGLSAEIIPSIDNGDSPNHGKIILNGKFSVTDFAGFTKSNLTGVGMPSFNTNETLFFEALDDKQLKAIWIPGTQYDERRITEILEGKQVSSTHIEKKRRLLMVEARLIK